MKEEKTNTTMQIITHLPLGERLKNAVGLGKDTLRISALLDEKPAAGDLLHAVAQSGEYALLHQALDFIEPLHNEVIEGLIESKALPYTSPIMGKGVRRLLGIKDPFQRQFHRDSSSLQDALDKVEAFVSNNPLFNNPLLHYPDSPSVAKHSAKYATRVAMGNSIETAYAVAACQASYAADDLLNALNILLPVQRVGTSTLNNDVVKQVGVLCDPFIKTYVSKVLSTEFKDDWVTKDYRVSSLHGLSNASKIGDIDLVKRYLSLAHSESAASGIKNLFGYSKFRDCESAYLFEERGIELGLEAVCDVFETFAEKDKEWLDAFSKASSVEAGSRHGLQHYDQDSPHGNTSGIEKLFLQTYDLGFQGRTLTTLSKEGVEALSDMLVTLKDETPEQLGQVVQHASMLLRDNKYDLEHVGELFEAYAETMKFYQGTGNAGKVSLELFPPINHLGSGNYGYELANYNGKVIDETFAKKCERFSNHRVKELVQTFSEYKQERASQISVEHPLSRQCMDYLTCVATWADDEAFDQEVSLLSRLREDPRKVKAHVDKMLKDTDNPMRFEQYPFSYLERDGTYSATKENISKKFSDSIRETSRLS